MKTAFNALSKPLFGLRRGGLVLAGIALVMFSFLFAPGASAYGETDHCIDPSANFTIDSAKLEGGNLVIDITVSPQMVVAGWADNFRINPSSSRGDVIYDRYLDGSAASVNTTQISGLQYRLTYAAPPQMRWRARESNRNYDDQEYTHYITMYPPEAKISYYQSDGLCPGFSQSRRVPVAEKSYNLRDLKGAYTLRVAEVPTDEYKFEYTITGTTEPRQIQGTLVNPNTPTILSGGDLMTLEGSQNAYNPRYANNFYCAKPYLGSPIHSDQDGGFTIFPWSITEDSSSGWDVFGVDRYRLVYADGHAGGWISGGTSDTNGGGNMQISDSVLDAGVTSVEFNVSSSYTHTYRAGTGWNRSYAPSYCSMSDYAITLNFPVVPDTVPPTIDQFELNNGYGAIITNDASQSTFITGEAIISDNISAFTCYASENQALVASSDPSVSVNCEAFKIPLSAGTGIKDIYFQAVDTKNNPSGILQNQIIVVEGGAEYTSLNIPSCPAATYENAGYNVAIVPESVDVYGPEIGFDLTLTPNARFVAYRDTLSDKTAIDTFIFSYTFAPQIWPINNSYNNNWLFEIPATYADGKYTISFNDFPAGLKTLTAARVAYGNSALNPVSRIYVYNKALQVPGSVLTQPCGFSTFETAGLQEMSDNASPIVTSTPDLPNMSWTNADTLEVTLDCNDVVSGCDYMKWQTASSESACADVSSWNDCSSTTGCNVTLTDYTYLCVAAQDIAMNPPTRMAFEVKIDDNGPIISQTSALNITSEPLELNGGIYYTNQTEGIGVQFNLQDDASGIPVTASCSVGGQTKTCMSGVNTFILGALTEGVTNNIAITAEDVAGNPSTTTTVFIAVEKNAPVMTGALTVDQDEATKSLILGLPSNISDEQGGSGPSHVILSVIDEVTGEPFDLATEGVVITPSDVITILPDGTLRVNYEDLGDVDQIIIEGLDGLGSYQVDVTAYDHAGNPSETISKSGVSFDSLPPVVNGFMYTGSNSFGSGTAEDPFRVGSDYALPLTLLLTDASNNTYKTASSPYTLSDITFDSVIDGALTAFDRSTICNSVMNDGDDCYASLTIEQIPEGFDGYLTFTVTDAGNNTSDPIIVYVKQNNSRPTRGENFNLYTNFSDPEVKPTKETTFVVTVEDIVDEENDGFFGYVTYETTSGSEQTRFYDLGQNLSTTATSLYKFEAVLTDLAYGTQENELSFYFTDKYGNRFVNDTETELEPVFFDDQEPMLQSYEYTWVNDNITITFTGIDEDSFPVRMSAKGITSAGTEVDLSLRKGDGLTSSTVTFDDTEKFANSTVTIVGVDQATYQEVRLVIGDTVYAYNALDEVVVSSNVQTNFIIRDILLQVAPGAAGSLELAYTLGSDANVADLADYVVEMTSDYGATATFTVPSISATSGSVGTIAYPVIGPNAGLYTFTSTLNYTDGRDPFTTSKTYTVAEDNLTPRITFAGLTQTEGSEITEIGELYLVRTTDNTLTLEFDLEPQYQDATRSIYDDSLPLVAHVEGGTIPVDVIAVASTDGDTGTKRFTVNVPLQDERLYNLEISISDDAENSYNHSISVLKDRSGPQTALKAYAQNDEITLVSNESTAGQVVLLTKSTDLTIEAMISNENGALNYNYALRDSEGSTIEPSENAIESEVVDGTRTYTVTYAGLQENAKYDFSFYVTDLAGNPTQKAMHVRTDNTAPVITAGEVRLDAVYYTVNPVPLDITFDTEYSNISYTLREGDSVIRTASFNGGILLDDGDNSNLTVTFSDALNNETAPYELLTETFVDTAAPEVTVDFSPDVTRTKATEITISALLINEIEGQVSYSVTNNGALISNGVIFEANYFTTNELATVELTPNSQNNIMVSFQDSHNPAAEHPRMIVHDDAAPVISDFLPSYEGDLISWTFKALDAMRSEITSVTAVLKNVTTGNTQNISVSSVDYTSGSGSYLAEAGIEARAGHMYRLEVDATDELESSDTFISDSHIFREETALESGDPLSDGPDISDLPIDGDTMTVVLSQNGEELCRVEEFPRGQTIVLADLIALCEPPLETLPVGTYDITIIDGEGTEFVLPPYVVQPYYFSPTADLNGDGFEGGISDHKMFIFEQSQESSVYLSDDPEIQAAVTAITELLRSKIIDEYLSFLRENL